MSDLTPPPAAQAPARRVEVIIDYVDGTTATVRLKPVALVATERHFKGKVPPIEGTLYSAHYLLTKEQGLAVTFADWMESIEGVEERAVHPSPETPPAPSPTSP